MNDTTKKEIEQRYNSGKKYIRAKEVSEMYGMGLSTVWLYAKDGKLTPKKISQRVTVFSVEEVEDLINSDEVA